MKPSPVKAPPHAFGFRVDARDGAARTGQLQTLHGTVETPAFMSVATFGAVRGVSFQELRELGAQILLSNTYHLHERPGETIIANQGGLHGFTGWRGPWLTDSGGYQVTSLSDRMRIDEDGVVFRSPLDGRERRLSPEAVIAIQEALGSDIAMVLDECHPALPSPADDDSAPQPDRAELTQRVRAATDRTLRWAERAQAARTRPDQAVFGIVQGGLSEALRGSSARSTAGIGFDGYAHGGLGLGESREQRRDLVSAVHAALPEQAPRYLMGLGRPVDLLDGIACGVDLFDCVLPTRNARHGVLFTSTGVLHLRNARFQDDPRPIDAGCDCPACTSHSRAYLRHLLRANESLGARLTSLHNLRFYLKLLGEARAAIQRGEFSSLHQQVADLAEARAD